MQSYVANQTRGVFEWWLPFLASGVCPHGGVVWAAWCDFWAVLRLDRRLHRFPIRAPRPLTHTPPHGRRAHSGQRGVWCVQGTRLWLPFQS